MYKNASVACSDIVFLAYTEIMNKHYSLCYTKYRCTNLFCTVFFGTHWIFCSIDVAYFSITIIVSILNMNFQIRYLLVFLHRL